MTDPILRRSDFGTDFHWGVSVAAYQIEGAHDADGKGHSIWDIFTNTKGRTHQNQNGNIACDFYNRYADDLAMMKQLHIPNFRFSMCWSRIMPEGHGRVNQKGIDHYNRLIDTCLELGIDPWLTLYHWDLPHALELKGGWTNRDVVDWFLEYSALCADKFGDRVKHWMILNEPMVFTGAGYFLGVHAPGRTGMKSFLPAVHHATLCMSEGGRLIKGMLPDAHVGTTFSGSHVEPYSNSERDQRAAVKVDALLNRLFIEPALGYGYPLADLRALRSIEKYMKPGDEERMKFDFDFIGIQNYTREIAKHSWFTPYLHARIVAAPKRKVPTTLMKWEVFPPSIYHMIMKYNAYPEIKEIIVTENGAAFTDLVNGDRVHDTLRKEYLKDYLTQVLKAKNDGAKVNGYFIWKLTDNFEWAEGFHPRFGIIYVDFDTQQRIVKDSGRWYAELLSDR